MVANLRVGPVLNSYPALQAYLFKLFTTCKTPDRNSNAQRDAQNGASHGVFWSTLSYTDFVTGNVPGVTDPLTGRPLRILIAGNSAQSNIIMALRGTPGSYFDPNTGPFGQMPGDGSGSLEEVQIAPLAGWIDAGCPY
jgi:hypothetical protein